MINSSMRKSPSSLGKTPRLFRVLLAIVGALMVIALVTGFVWSQRSPISLANADPEVRAQWLQSWEAGEVVVLVRHAERCDRSSNPCLGPADGITRAGSDAAAAVGQGLVRLGMTQADVLSSPLTRTAQTAHYMFGSDAQTQEWLATCGSTWRNDIVAHKRAHRNLVLVTHSGCIGDFEALNGFKNAAKSEYGSSLFVRIDNKGQLQVLGIMNAEDWRSLPFEKR
ncbi:histidine phosphatase family protein [Pseudomonas sp. WPR_5_2]|uniref:lipopolysaccharide core heptose(II)-phosphate phosphatase PmrG n=1 Tax=Pseudomonas sp. WPR_5_2 TaxID=1907371 RepID=UPI000EAC81BA|nr:histidine phosphatase family protein [Pseudomonas sp. WPR_5_2]